MKQAPAIFLTALLVFASAFASAEEVILRLHPRSDAPILNRITATEKVLLDAAPAAGNEDWRQLELKIPFEGYVPAAALTKNFAILQDTPVHFLPDASSATITRARDGDLYEIKSVKDEWATVRFRKQIKTYFRKETLPEEAPAAEREADETEVPAPGPPVLDLSASAPTHTPEPNAAEFDPSLGVAKISPDDLPPENVVWKSSSAAPAPAMAPAKETTAAKREPPQLPGGIMVGPGQTQAREADAANSAPTDKPLRLLVGTLVRKIDSADPAIRSAFSPTKGV